jgi:PX domain-containing protein kinase-like protein
MGEIMSDTTLFIIIAVVVGVVVFVASFVTYCICRRRRQSAKYERLPITEYLQKNVVLDNVTNEAKQDELLMHVGMYLRAKVLYNLRYPLFDIGSREDKHNFLLKGPHCDVVMTWVKKGAKTAYLNTVASRKLVLNMLTKLQHSNVVPILDTDFEDKQGNFVLYKEFFSKGSLKDLIYHSSPQDTYTQKYRKGFPLSEKKIASYGRQILDGLYYLESAGYPYYHLHTGNVLIDGNFARLSDIENSLLNLERFHEKIFVEFARNELDSIQYVNFNVVCFGCILYEMALGKEMNSVKDIDYYPAASSEAVKRVLVAIFRDSLRTAIPIVPSVTDLLRLPFFADVKVKQKHPERQPGYEGKEVEILKYVSKRMNKIKSKYDKDEDAISKAKSSNSLKRTVSSPKNASNSTTPAESANNSVKNTPAKTSSVKKSSSSGKKSKRQSTIIPQSESSTKLNGTTSNNGNNNVPPPPPPPVAPKMENNNGTAPLPAVSGERNNLLASIRDFNAKKLKHVKN